MSVITNKDIILENINRANGTSIEEASVVLGLPIPGSIKEVGLPVNAVPKRGYTGSVTVQYNKINLSEITSRFDLDYTVFHPTLTTAQLLEHIEFETGLRLILDIDIKPGIIHNLNNETRPIVLEASESSNTWKGSLVINVTAPAFDVYGDVQVITEPAQIDVYSRLPRTIGAAAVGNIIHIFETETNNHYTYNMDTGVFALKGTHPLYYVGGVPSGVDYPGEYLKKSCCTSYDGTKIYVMEFRRISVYDPAADTWKHYNSSDTSVNAVQNQRLSVLVDTPYGLCMWGGTNAVGSSMSGTPSSRAKLTLNDEDMTYIGASGNSSGIPAITTSRPLGNTAGVYYQDKVYIYGFSGSNIASQGYSDMAILDFANNTSETLFLDVGMGGTPTTYRSGDSFYGVRLGDKIVFAGGRNGLGRYNTEINSCVNLILIFDPSDNSHTYTHTDIDLPFAGGFGYYNGSLWLVKGALNEAWVAGDGNIPFLDIIKIT